MNLSLLIFGFALLGVIPVFAENYSVSIGIGNVSSGCETDNSCYVQSVMVIPVSSTVTWFNDDSIAHTVTSGKITDDYVGGSFNSGIIPPGGSYYHMFGKSGTYEYFSVLQPWMTGTIIVEPLVPQESLLEPDHEPMADPQQVVVAVAGAILLTAMLAGGISLWIKRRREQQKLDAADKPLG
jgi:plastocyanin